MREDLEDIIRILQKKSKRIVISTNGYFTDKIIKLAEKHRKLGIRVSLEGFPRINDELRGVKNSFERGLKTLLGLKKLGLKDIGCAITVSDKNAENMLMLYHLVKLMKMEFATAVIHNSYYFHKKNNRIDKELEVIQSFRKLIEEQLRSNRIKDWYRAFFNYGIINYIQGNKRLYPCQAGKVMFFLDPWGEVRPCNGMEKGDMSESMGNLNNATFEHIWNSDKAEEVRKQVKKCTRNCWMIGTASPAIKKHFFRTTVWVIKHKL